MSEPAKPSVRQRPAIAGHAGDGFTLIELLVVISIMMLLVGATIPAVRGPLDSISLTGASEVALAQFSLGRQMALSQNLPVEVRIYQDSTMSTDPYHIMALVIPAAVTGKAHDEWVAAPVVLTGNVIMDTSQSVFSSILTVGGLQLSGTTPNPVGPWAATEAATAPLKVRNLKYVAFRFLANGTTDLAVSGTTTWTLSLKNSHDTSNGTTPAANYVALVIDPLTGRALTYQP